MLGPYSTARLQANYCRVAVLATDDVTFATGVLRAGSRVDILEFVVTVHLCPELKIESATIVRELGLGRHIQFRLLQPPDWNAALKCWNLQFVPGQG